MRRFRPLPFANGAGQHRRRFTPGITDEAARQGNASGRAVAKVARDTPVNEGRWVPGRPVAQHTPGNSRWGSASVPNWLGCVGVLDITAALRAGVLIGQTGDVAVPLDAVQAAAGGPAALFG